MNLSGSIGLSPTSFRRVLTAHGRSTTPGLLQDPTTVKHEPLSVPVVPVVPVEVEQKQEIKSEHPTTKVASANPLAVAAKAEEVAVMDKLSSYQSDEMQRARDLVNLPVSKAKVSAPTHAADSYSFYKRSFRVQGMQAWEYAMRDLGSVDTLMNRYGYVEPHQRLDVSPVRRSKVSDS